MTEQLRFGQVDLVSHFPDWVKFGTKPEDQEEGDDD